MPQKKISFSADLQDYRPIIWYGEPVYIRYPQLVSILHEKLGQKYSAFLAEPVISKENIENKGKAHWMSDYINQGVNFSTLPENQQEAVRQNLHLIINKIKSFSKELIESADAVQKELGELLLLAIEVPSLNNVIVEDDKIVLVLWGFSSEEAKKHNFQLSKQVENLIGTVIVPPVVNQQPVQPEIDEKLKIEKQLEDRNKQQNNTQVQSTQNPPVTPPPPVTNNQQENKKKKFPAWLWFILGALLMFLIMFLIWFFLLRDRQTSYLPDEPGKLPPIDTTKTGYDPDDPTKRKIFTDKVNIALDKNTNIEEFAKKLHDKFKDDLEIIYYDTVIKLMQVKTPEGEWKKWRDTLKNQAGVKLAFNDALFDKGEKPTDPDFSDKKKAWYFDIVQAYQAWEITKGKPEVVVAILDNGFDLTHPEFAGKIVKPWNVVEGNDKCYPVGNQGSEHGTHVAGTAIGLENNSLGLCGIAPGCSFMPVQLGNKDGLMPSLAIVAGVLYAIHHEADVINMSLGMMFPEDVTKMPEKDQEELVQSLYPDEAKFWNELFEFGRETNAVIVLAAGNQNILAGIDPFSRSDKVLVVSAYTPEGTKAEFSNYGQYSYISAPGEEIYSSTPNKSFAFLQGTSMASPIVTGGVALLKSVHPDWTSKQIIDALVKTAIPIESEASIGPLIQLANALNYNGSDSVTIIPDKPKDLSFAEGKWKSTTDLISTVDNKKVELFFDINKDGTGKLTLIEQSGNKCKADLDVKFENGKLLIVQEDNAECEKDNKYYQPYKFECSQGEDNAATCVAKQKDGSGDLISFKMKKL